MRVIYGTEVDTTVRDNVSADSVMSALRENYSELANASYAITTEDGSRVMRITLRSGSKASK